MKFSYMVVSQLINEIKNKKLSIFQNNSEKLEES